MGASMTVNLEKLKVLSSQINNPAILSAISRVAQEKAIAAIIAQAIADNFAQEGPGWTPLSPATIRSSVAKGVRRKLSKMSREDVMKYEAKARKSKAVKPNRRILDRSGVLRGSVTTPNGQNNIYYTEGSNIVWGTSLPYAGTHNYGNPSKGIPQREFLKIRDAWMKELCDYVLDRYVDIIMGQFGGQQ